MSLRLYVRTPFPGHNHGDVVTDLAKVAAILNSEFSERVVKVAAEIYSGPAAEPTTESEG